MVTTAFVIVASIMLLGVGMIWSKRDFLNLAIKVSFFSVGLWGLVTAGSLLGYIVKIGGG